ncbi:MAG: hypothetical protein K0M56_09325 [Kaistella sp.]|nr:hypothetical protein [Kaistella sp.]
MQKGFSITISEQETDIQSFISEDYDNCYLQTDQFEFLLEGVLLNKKKLLNDHAVKDFETLIRELYLNKKENLIKEFEGEYRGFIFDKSLKKIYAFTNITSTQRVFYGIFQDKIFIDSSLVRLNKTLQYSGIRTQPNIESIYQFLCFSNLPENKTPIENIFKVLDGHYIEIECSILKIVEKPYFNIAETPVFSNGKSAAIDAIHQIFTDSVQMEYEKDTELNTNHLALLSGGLDSRIAMLYALKNGQIPQNVLCFSQTDYLDHTISRKIAQDYDLHYEFIPLDGGIYLKKIDELTEISEGMVFFTGGIHVKHAVENIQYENFALFHSGQIGDGVLGGFLTGPERKKPGYFKIVQNHKFLPKVQDSLKEILKKHETEELFLLRNIAYNRTVLGAHVFQEKRYQTSPFMTKEFLKLAISLPEAWKYNHHFYLEWIAKYCPEATKYRWERTLMKPDAKWKTAFGDQVVKRGFKIAHDKILKTPQKSSMYPYQYYFDSDADIQNYYRKYFDENLYRVESYPELSADLLKLFDSADFYSKSQAVNILSVFKLYF